MHGEGAGLCGRPGHECGRCAVQHSQRAIAQLRQLGRQGKALPECIDLCIWLMVGPFCSMGCALSEAIISLMLTASEAQLQNGLHGVL